MPKIIENVRETLLEEAKRQIRVNGWAKTTVRSVSSACGVAVGTVYNYFPSKEMLIAAGVAEDWEKALVKMGRLDRSDKREYVKGLYGVLSRFSEKNAALFSDPDAAKVYAAVFSGRHPLLRSQLAVLFSPLCREKEFLPDFLAEAVLTWNKEKIPFETLYPVLEKLIE